MNSSINELAAAAQEGNTQAQNDLGILIAQGSGVKQDYKVAACLFNESANSGHPHGIVNLAQCFAEGLGVDKNLENALELLGRVRRLRKEWTESYIEIQKKYKEESLNRNPFFLVKITKREWAEQMLTGKILMRPLSDFWTFENEDESVNNSYRGDNNEAISKSFTEDNIPTEAQDFFVNTGIRFKNAALQDLLLSQNMIYCMYTLEYDKSKSQFVLPDRRVAQFGDTAVVVCNCNEFLRRLTAAKVLKCGYSSWISFKRVEYNVNLDKDQSYDEFCKGSDYAWQNEFRVAIDVSNGKLNKQNWENTTDFIKLTSRFLPGYNHEIPSLLPLSIGNISDICVLMPINEFLHLKNFDDAKIRQFVPPQHAEMMDIEKEPIPTVYRPMVQL